VWFVNILELAGVKKGSVSRETLPFYFVADYRVEFIVKPAL